MRIIDAQVHIWSSGTPIEPHRPTSVFTKDALLAEMAEAGVDAAVIHPPSWDPNSNAVAITAVRAEPKKFAILGHFPLDRPECRGLVDTWKQQPGMLGLRYALVRPEQQTWHADGTMDWLWPAAERAGLPVALLAGRPAGVSRHRGAASGVELIIDHLGLVRRTKDAAAFATLPICSRWQAPNVAIKATGAPSCSSQPYPYRNITMGCGGSMMRMVRGDFSGAPTSRGCRAAIGSV